MSRPLHEEWKNPGPAFRGKPFWSWNGKLKKEELFRQLGIFKEMGMGGVFFHSRTGLATEYLGPEWMALTNDCADEAERLGLEAWLYDEDRWPSGSAGGKATKELKHSMKYLRLEVFRPGDQVVWPSTEHFVAAFSAELEGLDLGSYERLSAGATPPENRALLVFSWEYMTPHSFYNGGAYLDTLSRDATEHFLSITHDRYAESCGDRVGKSIHGIFTDEPHRGFVFCDIHGQPGPSNTEWITTWTPRLWEEFSDTFGYDLRDRLPELFLRVDGRLSPVKWAYMEIIQRMFLENWAKPLQDRCRQLGFTLTGHALHEDSLTGQVVPCGSIMRYYEYLDFPGVDVLGLDNRNFWIVKQLTSVARQTGKKWLLSELYGCSGWSMEFDGHKRIGDWQALLGINVRCHHLSWYSMAGESKRDYPASIFYQSSWHQDYEQVETYFSRMHVMLQQGSPACDVLVINPVESLWAQVHVDWSTWLDAKTPEVLRLEKTYQTLFGWLSSANIDFDYGDEDQLARLSSVTEGEARLQVGEMSYRTVLVGGLETVRGSTLDLLRRFSQAGGTLVFAGDPPAYVDTLLSEDANILAQQSIHVPLESESILTAVRSAGGFAADWLVSPSDPAMMSQVRIDGPNRLAALLNTDPSRDLGSVTCRARSIGPVVEYNCLTGQTFSIPSQESDGWQIWETTLPPLQERVFRFGPETEPSNSALPVELEADVTTAIPGPFAYELDEPNLCVLDVAEWKAGAEPWQPRAEVLRIEEALADRFGIPLRSGVMVQPWATENQTSPTTVPLALRFSFSVGSMPTAPVDLLIEQPEKWRISINGQSLAIPSETSWLIDPCFRRITLPQGFIIAGKNEIVLESSYGHGTDLEAIYLAGSFGVDLGSGLPVLGNLPSTLAPCDISTQGLPFYSGRISYHLPWSGRAGRLHLPALGAAAAVFRRPDGSLLRRVPWAPFVCEIPDGLSGVIVELPLTRRNTFGPLHRVLPPPLPGSFGEVTGPESFRTKDAEWSDDYQLIGAGLLAAPLES